MYASHMSVCGCCACTANKHSIPPADASPAQSLCCLPVWASLESLQRCADTCVQPCVVSTASSEAKSATQPGGGGRDLGVEVIKHISDTPPSTFCVRQREQRGRGAEVRTAVGGAKEWRGGSYRRGRGAEREGWILGWRVASPRRRIRCALISTAGGVEMAQVRE